MKMVIILITLLIKFEIILSYRYSVFEEYHADLCNNQKCDGKPHTACHPVDEISPKCEKFEKMAMTRSYIREIILGHNGLRNRVAKDYFYPSSNMNLLHWDKDLARLADLWVNQCSMEYDECDFLYNKETTIGQTINFFPEYPHHIHWSISVIRKWYLEGNHFDHKHITSLPAGMQLNYTQLVWANAEFVGCAAAKMFDGYLLVCYYNPRGNIIGKPVYAVGSPCTDCSLDRPSCSRIFNGLCGIDIKIGVAAISKSSKVVVFLLAAVVLPIHIIFFV